MRDLSVSFQTQDGLVEAVKKLSFSVAPGECFGLVGESGSGKSQTVLAAMGLTAANGKVEGSILFDGVEMNGLDQKQLNAIRGARISMIFQDPLTSLTPHMTVGAQMAEVLARHKNLKGKAAEQVWVAPVASTSVSNGIRAPSLSTSDFPARSKLSTSPKSTRVFFCFRKIERSGEAILAGESAPVAT